jgi:hypothetical protein
VFHLRVLWLPLLRECQIRGKENNKVIFTDGKLQRLHLHPKKVGMLPLGPGKQTENFTASEDSFTAKREIGRIEKFPIRGI